MTTANKILSKSEMSLTDNLPSCGVYLKFCYSNPRGRVREVRTVRVPPRRARTRRGGRLLEDTFA